jgi:hypothetical protein
MPPDADHWTRAQVYSNRAVLAAAVAVVAQLVALAARLAS